jgi:maltose-binding protein MalE
MDKNKIVMIAPVAVAVILMLAVVAAMSSTNQSYAATTTATTLTLQVHTSTKTLGKLSDMVPLTISGRLWTKDFSRAIPGATIKISCDGKECGTSDTDSNGHYSASTSLNAICTVGICTHSTNTIKASTLKCPRDMRNQRHL